MGYRFFEHTADIQAECTAKSFAGLLESAAHAFYSVALKKQRKATNIRRELFISGATREEIVVRWLQELVFLLETDGFVAVRFECDGAHLEKPGKPREVLTAHCEASGYLCKGAERADEVKGATYHGLEVRETEQGFVARVIFDL